MLQDESVDTEALVRGRGQRTLGCQGMMPPRYWSFPLDRDHERIISIKLRKIIEIKKLENIC